MASSTNREARRAGDERDRDEDDADAQRRHEGGRRDLHRTVQDRLDDGLFMAVAVEVLDLDGGVIDQDAHGEGRPGS